MSLPIVSQLCRAISDRDLAKIQALIRDFDAINEYSDEYSATPLVQAIDLQQVDVVRLLLNAGADVQLTFWDFTPLGLAAIRGNLEIVQLLLDAGADPSIGGEEPPLSSAIEQEDVQLFQVLLEAGSSVNLENSSDITSLMQASLLGRLDFVQALVSAGADVNYVNHDGQTALIKAAYNGHQEVFDYLFPLTAESEWKNYAKQILPNGIRRKEIRQKKLIRIAKDMF